MLTDEEAFAAWFKDQLEQPSSYADSARVWHAALAWRRSQEKKLTCGHPDSLLLRSAETDQPLYCELCDAQSARRDAESMEAGMRAELDALRGQAPVAWVVNFRRNTHIIDRLVVFTRDRAEKEVARHLIVSVYPLYATPQLDIPDGLCRHEREQLAMAIRNAAVRAGICKDDVELTGPQLLMLCDDMGEALEKPAIPDGWRLVPVEPTPEMVKAGNIGQGFSKDALKAAIAAAPEPKSC